MFNYPSHRPDWAPDEVADLQFFMEILGASVREYSDSGFFNIVVPCLANFDIGIRNLVLAVACTHRNILSPKEVNGLSAHIKALERCNKAIDILSRRSTTTPPEALQTSCILLTCWYMLRLDSKAAANCIRAAERLCRMDNSMWFNSRIVSARNATDPEAISNYRRSTFATIITGVVAKKRLETAAVSDCSTWIEGRNRLSLELNLSSQELRHPVRDIHDVLSSMEIISPFYHQLRVNIAHNAHIKRSSSLAQDLLAHVEKIATILTTTPRSSERIVLAVNILWYWITYYYIGLHCHVLSHSEMSWDMFTVEFGALIVRAERHLSQGRSQGTSPYVFLPVEIIIHPLWFITVHCRDPTIRRCAIALLLKHHHNEFGVDSWIAGHVGQELVHLEEGIRIVRSASDIHERDRILLRGFRYQDEQLYLLYLYATEVGEPEAATLRRHPFSIPRDPHGVVESMKVDSDVSYLHSLVALLAQATPGSAPEGRLVPIYYDNELIEIILPANGE